MLLLFYEINLKHLNHLNFQNLIFFFVWLKLMSILKQRMEHTLLPLANQNDLK